jgi:hypothetical protein
MVSETHLAFTLFALDAAVTLLSVVGEIFQVPRQSSYTWWITNLGRPIQHESCKNGE